MKIKFLFGGALTATQQAAVQHEIDEGNEVEVCSSIGADADFDLLVYGAGFGGFDELSNATPFAAYFEGISIDEIIPKPIDSVRVNDCCDDCDGDCDEESEGEVE